MGFLTDNTDGSAFLELPEGAGAAVSPAGLVRLRNNGGLVESSNNAAAYAPLVSTIEYVAATQVDDLTLTSTSIVTDPTDLILGVLSNGLWVVEACALWLCGGGSTDGFDSDWDFDGTVTAARQRRAVMSWNTQGSGVPSVNAGEVTTSLGAQVVTTGVGGDTFITVDKVSFVVTVPGTLIYRCAKDNDAGADTTFLKGSWAIARKQI